MPWKRQVIRVFANAAEQRERRTKPERIERLSLMFVDYRFHPYSLVVFAHDVRAIAAQPLIEAIECVLKWDAAGAAHTLGFIVEYFSTHGAGILKIDVGVPLARGTVVDWTGSAPVLEAVMRITGESTIDGVGNRVIPIGFGAAAATDKRERLLIRIGAVALLDQI